MIFVMGLGLRLAFQNLYLIVLYVFCCCLLNYVIRQSNSIMHPTRGNIALFQEYLLRAGDDER
jgi:hypothetical protein